MLFDPTILDTLWFKSFGGLLMGPVLGSFTTMLSYRLPRGLSIISPPSTCPSCKTRLGLRDLVPLLSFLCAHGKCRHCGAAIGRRYFVIESLTTLACLAAFLGIGFHAMLAPTLALIVAAMTFFTIRFEKKA